MSVWAYPPKGGGEPGQPCSHNQNRSDASRPMPFRKEGCHSIGRFSIYIVPCL